MNCGGKYKYHHYELECKKKCKHYTFRTKKQTIPRSKTKDCEHFIPRYSDEFIKEFGLNKTQ